MDEILQWGIATLIGTSSAAFLALFNKSFLTLKTDLSPKENGQKRNYKLHTLKIKKQIVHIPIRTQCSLRQQHLKYF